MAAINELRKMEKQNLKVKKTAQEIQDKIFRKISADEKVKLGSQLWKLAKDLAGDKVNYASERPKRTFGKHS